MLSGKVDAVSGKGLSTNDYTTTEKNKLAGIAEGAEVNVNADWNASSGDAQILNKPTKLSDFTNDNNFVTNTDYPTSSVAGVVKGNVNGFGIGSTGNPFPQTFTYQNYTSAPEYTFIGKGTLENVLANKTNTSVIPNDNGHIKTKYRISNSSYTGSTSTAWYFPLCKLPTDDNGNYASAIISGRIGGWISANMSYINALAWNRSGTGISVLDIAGSSTAMSDIWNTCDIVIYTDAQTVSETANDGGKDTVYLKCVGYYTFDLDLELFQSTAEILYDGTYLTTTPSGTLVAQASTSNQKMELINGELLVNKDNVRRTISGNGRITSADIPHYYTNNNVHQQLDIATNSMTTNKPAGDGYIQTFLWDSNGAYDTQIYIPNGNTRFQVRYRRNNDSWGSWINLPIMSDIPTKTSQLTNDSSYVVNTNSYLNTHPENSPVLIPFIHNDIAFLNVRGGSYKIFYDDVEQTGINIQDVFDGSGSYGLNINPTSLNISKVTIELTLHKVFGWTNTIYCDFGASGWRSKAVKIEVMNTNYASDVWTSKLDTTTNALGNIKTTFNHTPVGASNAGGGYNKIRFTFSDFNNATIFRIAQLGIYFYGSSGVRETSMSRGKDDYVFRNITPNSNNTYNLGSSSNKWANVYATTFQGNATSATKATGDKNGADITTTYQKKLTAGTNITIDSNNVISAGGGGVTLEDVYPVGSIYMSVTSTSPATLFGFGTWEQIKDTFLLSAGDTYTAGSTGGETTHTLTVDEIPSHSHYVAKNTNAGNTNTYSTTTYLAARGQTNGGGDYRNYWLSSTSSTADVLKSSNVGGGLAHNNMPPYLTVYMWKRTA